MYLLLRKAMSRGISHTYTNIVKWIDRHHRWFVPVCILAYTLLITGLWLPFHWSKFGSLDHSLTYTSYEAIRLLVWEYAQFPLYLQNINGGLDLWADPQSMTLGLFAVFPLLLGSIVGHKVAILVAYLLGTSFTYHLAKKIQHNPFFALLISLCYASLGYFAHHIIEAGHSNFLYFQLVPMLGYAVYTQYANRITVWNTLVVVVVYTQIVLGGALPMLVITLCCLVSMLLVSTWPNYKFTLFQASLGIGSIVLSAIKIYPFFAVFGSSPRVVSDTAGMNLQHLLMALVDSKPLTESGSISYHGWWEHGIGIGIIIPIVAIYFLPKLSNWKGVTVVLLLTTWFAMGNSPSYANPWYIANTYLPVFENFRAPFRFFIGPTLALLFIVVLGIKKQPHHRPLLSLLLLLSLGYNTANVLAISKSMTTSRGVSEIVNAYKKPSDRVVSVQSAEDEVYQYLNLQEDKHLVNTHYPLLDHVKHSSTTFCSGADVIANNQTFLRLLATASTVHTSLNFSPYWQCEGGTIINQNGKLTIATKTGSTVALKYAPTYWPMAIGLSITGFVFLLLVMFWGIRTLQPTANALLG